jgi:hypothetical protein
LKQLDEDQDGEVMTTKDQVAQRIIHTMNALSPEADWPISFEMVQRLVTQTIEDWHEDIDGKITTLIKDWELRMEDDNSLYSLGLRRAQDVVRGIEVHQ